MCWRSHHLWLNRVPEQRGSHTFLSLQGKTTTTTSRGYCSVPTVSVPAMEHFQTTTVKHLERLSRRGEKNYKNHTTKIYSRNVFPKLTLYSQNSEGPKAILGTFAFWFCRLALCFNFTLFYIFTGKECFIRCPQIFFFVWLVQYELCQLLCNCWRKKNACFQSWGVVGPFFILSKLCTWTELS